MADIVVFNILIACTENATGIVHAPSKFDGWVIDTADRFGGITVVGLALQGLFGQKCLYFERAGEAEFVWDPAFDPNLVG